MDFLSQLAQQGLLGLLLALSLFANFLLLKMILAEKDKQIEAAHKVQNEIAAPLANIKDSIDLLQQKVRISKAAEHENS